MQLYERDFLFYRIVSGYIYINKGDSRYKFITAPSLDILYEASEVYYETFKKAKNEGLMDDREIVDFLYEQNLWNDDDELVFTKNIPEYIDNIKVEMYQKYKDLDFISTAKKYIDTANKKYMEMFNRRHCWDHISCQGVANFTRWQFIIENCTLKNNEPVYLTTIAVADMLEEINASRISESEIREISRTEPWRSVWYSGKKCTLMTKQAVEFSDDQKRLIHWSFMYDSILENPECPPDEVIEDDDCLDGWMILRRRKQQKEKKKTYLEERIGNNAKAPEVFVMVKNEKEAEDVMELNDIHAANIIKQRKSALQKFGELREDQFHDVKQDLAMTQAKSQFKR